MTFSLHATAAGTFSPKLRMLSTLLDKGVEHVRANGADPAALLQARLAPDMFPLVAQVQIACDHVKDAVARLTGREAPAFATTETTPDELRERIAKVLDFLETTPEAAFAGAEARAIEIPMPNMSIAFHMNGAEYLRDWALPNFYFHLVTAYDILRREGVQLGKRDYMSQVAQYARPTA